MSVRPGIERGRGLRLAFALVVAGALSLASVAGAQRRECVDCHKDFKDVMKRSHVHQPAKQSCETCHKRHGFTQKLTLVKGMPELCTDCHADVKTEMAGVHVHGALAKGGCTGCHDPHASDGKGLLRTEEKQSALCVTCHRDLEAALAEKDAHEPFKKGECSTCHAPHSSSNGKLLVANEKELCERCHPGAAAKHKIIGVGDFSCSSCHDPHRSSKKAKVAANAHDPFAQGECDACHTVEGGKVTIGDGFPPKDLCQSCHDDVAGLVAGPTSHFGSAEIKAKGSAACLECHDPHVSGRPAMLVAEQNDLCRKCHESLPQVGKHKGSMHAPFAAGQCTTCHNPHGGSAPHKLVKASNELCVTCHADIVKAPAPGKTAHAAMKSESCTDCHSGHAAEGEALLTKSVGETCAKCHDKEAHKHTHLPYQTGACDGCHRNHSHEKDLLAKSVKETCLACHTDQLKAMAATTKHPPVQEEDCLLCHAAHGSENKGLLTESQHDLCSGCHELNDLVVKRNTGAAGEREAGRKTAVSPLHPPVANGECSACHDVHGSPLPSLLVRSGDVLCYGCHAQQKIDFAAGHVHPPVAEGKCTTCHAPHGSELGDLAVKPQPEVCSQCHDFAQPKFKEAHKKIDVSQAKCTQCHAPHSAATPALLNAVVHEPFADGDCGTCHEVATTPEGVSRVGAVAPTLCYDCHDDKQAGTGHQQVKDVACVSCHEPHSSPFAQLLKRPDTLCRGCHENVLKTSGGGGRPTVVHKAIENGGCRECHKLHEPAASPFLARAQGDLCSGCHESIKNRAADKTKHPPFGKGECSKCHETHVANEQHLLKTAEADLCKSCHNLKTTAMARAHGNVPLTGKACVSCHDPHSTAAAASKLVYPKKHPPYEEKQCDACHDSGGKPTATLSTCTECHDGHDGYAAVHKAGRGGDQAGSVGVCLDCHSPHAGHDHLLVKSSVKETCLQCHDRRMFTKKFQHAALDEGCDACHNVHENRITDLRGPRVNELCAGCHETKGLHTHAVSGVTDPRDGTELNCVSCHDPHSADHEHLLPFDYKRDLCVQCHATGTSPQ